MTAQAVISDLECSAQKSISTDAVYTAMEASLKTITPWMGAKPKHAAAAGLVKDIQTAAKTFFQAIDETIKTARIGYTFAKEAETLCGYLLDRSAKHGHQSIPEHIEGMQKTAKEALEMASHAVKSVRKSREEFNGITGSVISLIEGKASDHSRIEENAETAREREQSWWDFTKGAFFMPKKIFDWSPAPGIVGAIISVPFVIPVVVVSGIGTAGVSLWTKHREGQLVESEDLLKYLETMSGEVENLTEKLNTVADYWVEMETILGDMRKHSDNLQDIHVRQLRVKQLRKDWRGVKAAYSDYAMQLMKLQDSYPASKQIG